MELYFLILFAAITFSLMVVNKNKGTVLVLRTGSKKILSCNVKYYVSFLMVFLLLAFFIAVREGIGVDYNGYLHHISLIQRGEPQYMEIGFKTLVKTLQRINDDPRIVMSVCGVITTWLYVKAIWEQSDCIPDSVFIFITWGYYFLSYNTVRNYLALAIVLYAIKYLEQEKKIVFVVFVLIAASFHKSALICIPIYLISNLRWKKYYYALVGGFTVLALCLKEPLRRIAFYFYSSYEGTVYDSGRISYLNILKALLVIAICLLSFRIVKEDKLNRLYFNLNVCSLAFYIGMYWVPEISRIGFYMNATSILIIPRVLRQLGMRRSGSTVRIFVYASSILLFLLLCIGFYGDTIQLLPYKSWLF